MKKSREKKQNLEQHHVQSRMEGNFKEALEQNPTCRDTKKMNSSNTTYCLKRLLKSIEELSKKLQRERKIVTIKTYKSNVRLPLLQSIKQTHGTINFAITKLHTTTGDHGK